MSDARDVMATQAAKMAAMQEEIDAEQSQSNNPNTNVQSPGEDNMTLVNDLPNSTVVDSSQFTVQEHVTEATDLKGASGYIAFYKPGFSEENEGFVISLGDDIPFISKRAVTAFAGLCQDRYSVAEVGTILLKSDAQSHKAVRGYTLSTSSGQVVVDGNVIDLPVNKVDGVTTLVKDPLFGYKALDFIDFDWAYRVVAQKEYKMTPKQAKFASQYWKAYAIQSFVIADTVKIQVGPNSINYVRKVLANRNSVEDAQEAMNTAAFNKREYARNMEVVKTVEAGETVVSKATGKAVEGVYAPKLVVFDADGVPTSSEMKEDLFINAEWKEVAWVQYSDDAREQPFIKGWHKVTNGRDSSFLAGIYKAASVAEFDLSVKS